MQGDLRPDLTIYLDLPVETSLARIAGSLFREPHDRFEREHFEFFTRVRRTYLERCRRHPGRYLRIDARCEPQEVTRAILAALKVEPASGAAVARPPSGGARSR